MENLWIKEEHICEELNGSVYKSHVGNWYETFTSNKGELFKSLQRKFGKAQRMYIGVEGSDEPKQVGWIFEKKRIYPDSKEKYTQSVWVEVSKTKPVIKRVRVVENIEHPF